MNYTGDRRSGRILRHYKATFKKDPTTKSTCKCCGGPTRRSKYGILHKDCYGCRYLKMIFGPSIEVTREVY